MYIPKINPNPILEVAKNENPDNLAKNEIKNAIEHIKELTAIEARNFLLKIAIYSFCLWLIFIGALLILVGFRIYYFTLPASVLLALVAGSTVNVIGLLIIVYKFFFNINLFNILDIFVIIRKIF